MAFAGAPLRPCTSSSDSPRACYPTSYIARSSKWHSVYLSEFGGSVPLTSPHAHKLKNVLALGIVEVASSVDSRTSAANTQALVDDASLSSIDGVRPADCTFAVMGIHDYELKRISEADLLRLRRARLEALGLSLLDFDREEADRRENKEDAPLGIVQGHEGSKDRQRYTRKGVKVAVRSSKRKERSEKRERACANAREKSVSVVANVQNSLDAKTRQAKIPGLMPDHIRSFLMKNSSGSSKLLTAAEEVSLSNKIQDLLAMISVKERLHDQLGREPTLGEWADEMQMKPCEFTSRLAEGQRCKNKMIQCNLRLVISVARKYEGKGLSIEDLIQEGSQGLIRGCEKFDPKKGCKFSTYAHWWIMQAITKALVLKSRFLRIPCHASDAILAIRRVKDDLKMKYGHVPSDRVISKCTGISTERQRMLSKASRHCRSFDKPVGKDSNINLAEMIADPSNTPSECKFMQTLLKEDLDSVLKTLRPREREVVRLRYGLGDGHPRTLKEIGGFFHVTRERIRQIECKAMLKLKDPQKSELLRGMLNEL